MTLDYWCHSCDKLVFARDSENDGPICSDCGMGFIERHDMTYPHNSTALNQGSHPEQFRNLFQMIVHSHLENDQQIHQLQPNRSASYNVATNVNSHSLEEGVVSVDTSISRTPRSTRNRNRHLTVNRFEGRRQNDHLDFMSLVATILSNSGFDTDEILNRSMNDEVKGPPPASEKAISTLNKSTVVAEMIKQSNACPVCMVVYELDEELKTLPCNHFFHSKCITHWLKLHNTCPVCRCALPIDEDKEDKNCEDSSPTSNTDAPPPFN